jgi:hypothetical protein
VPPGCMPLGNAAQYLLYTGLVHRSWCAEGLTKIFASFYMYRELIDF